MYEKCDDKKKKNKKKKRRKKKRKRKKKKKRRGKRGERRKKEEKEAKTRYALTRIRNVRLRIQPERKIVIFGEIGLNTGTSPNTINRFQVSQIPEEFGRSFS